MRRRDVFYAAVIIALLAAVCLGRRAVDPVGVQRLVDTVVLRDTVRDTVLVPVRSWLTRTDTVFLRIPGDTVFVGVEVPVERRVFQTEDYRATIEGFRPQLIDMEIYRRTSCITQTEIRTIPLRRRWGLGIQAGYGYNFDRMYPYIGVGVQYNLICW